MEFLEALDQGAHPWFQLLHRPWLDQAIVWLSTLGSRPVLTIVVIGVACLLVVRRRLRSAVILLGIAVTASLLDDTVKALVGRPRPEVVHPVVPVPATGSFPSGHALNATAVYGTAALLATTRTRRRRTLLIAAGLLLALGVGLTRLYLGVHYLTDVLGGWAAGLALALFARWLDERWALRGGDSVR